MVEFILVANSVLWASVSIRSLWKFYNLMRYIVVNEMLPQEILDLDEKGKKLGLISKDDDTAIEMIRHYEAFSETELNKLTTHGNKEEERL